MWAEIFSEHRLLSDDAVWGGLLLQEMLAADAPEVPRQYWLLPMLLVVPRSRVNTVPEDTTCFGC